MTPTPDISCIRAVSRRISPWLLRTPTVCWAAGPGSPLARIDLNIKLELMQRTGSFKPRGALNVMLGQMPIEQGVTAFSAGNHAIATAFAAQALDVPACVVMPKSANAFRVERCRAYGAESEFGETIADLLGIVERLQAQGHVLVHPFEGPDTVAGTATVGLELCEDLSSIDVLVVPVGGGGLIAGVASAVRQLQPDCRIIGVEPTGARGMADSLAAGSPLSTVPVNTIADSLGAPLHLPLTFSLIQQHVDELVQVEDAEIRQAMAYFLADMKMAVEPACAASLAAVLFPLASRLAGQRVALIACGSNIDLASYQRLMD